MSSLLTDEHLLILAEALYDFDKTAKGYRIDFAYLDDSSKEYYKDMATAAAECIYAQYTTGY